MNEAILMRLIIGLIALGCVPFYALYCKAKVPRISYLMTIIGMMLVGFAFLMIAGVKHLALIGDDLGRLRLFRVSIFPALTGAAALLYSIFNNGFPKKQCAVEYEKSALLIHKQLSVIYVVILLIVTLCFNRHLQHLIGIDSRSVMTTLGEHNMLLVHSGLFILYALQLVVMTVLWLTGNAERAVRSKFSTIAPPFILMVLCGGLYIPVWLHIQRLVANGMLWHADARGSIIFIVQWILMAVMLNLFAWHGIIGSGYFYNKIPISNNRNIYNELNS